uniref:Protein aael aael001955 aedes aegypti n=1 Tax=Corethrella appendiculata TaxID=1370023 RepID=U5EZN2_9DIPT
MPSGKARIPKANGNLKPFPKTLTKPCETPPSGSGIETSQNANDSSQTFQLELYWCIHKLEESFSSAHLQQNPKKADDTRKLINILKSSTQPIIKKRQIMRQTFGDYRSKMTEEEKTLALDPSAIKFTKPTTTTSESKSHFIKKSSILSEENKNFKFNFKIDEDKSVENADKMETDDEKEKVKTNVKYATIQPSDNSFRFNFSIE